MNESGETVERQFCCGVKPPKPQCEDCPMKAWDLNYEEAVEFANGILADAARHKDYRPSEPSERLINLAREFFKIAK